MLQVLKDKSPLFMDQIYPKVKRLNKNIDSLRDGLLRLYRRGFVIRKKAINLNSKTNFNLHYQFSISQRGINLIKSLENHERM